jgi:5-formyltetrahydrofolate cyclo-ligase
MNREPAHGPAAATPTRAETDAAAAAQQLRAGQRREGRRRRRALSTVQRKQASRQITRHLAATHWLHPGARVACFVSMPDEVDTFGCIALALARRCRIYLPRITAARQHRMHFAPLGGPMQRGHYDIPEPVTHEYCAARWFDLILVPLVGFDARGGRLGMGAGYYDRALAFRLRHRHWLGPKLVGVAFDCQEFPQIELGRHDVRLDAILTESGLRHATR